MAATVFTVYLIAGFVFSTYGEDFPHTLSYDLIVDSIWNLKDGDQKSKLKNCNALKSADI